MRKIKLQHCLNSLLLFITFYSFGQVTTTITDLKVNNTTSSGIAFNSNPTVTAKFDVDLLTFNGASNNILGNIHIYIKINSSSRPFQVGWSPITFSVDYPPNNSQGTYTNKTPFTVELSKSFFYASGGVLYAEYKNNDGKTYKSVDVPITGGNYNPTVIVPKDLRIINVKNEFYDVCQDKIYLDESQYSVKVLFDFDHKVPAGTSTTGWYYINIYDKKGYYVESLPWYSFNGMAGNTFQVRNRMFMLPTRFFSEGGSIRIMCNLVNARWESSDYYVQNVKFSSRNTISAPLEITEGEAVNFIGTNVEVAGGKVLDLRYNTYRDVFVPIDGERWYKRTTTNGEWELIGETLPVPYTLNTTTEFLRRSFYKGAFADSNVVKVLVTPISEINYICCDQQLISYNEPLKEIIGNTPTLRVLSYAWQRFSRTEWVDIAGATTKNYTPDSSIMTGRTSYSFRRVVKLANGQVHYSNIVYVYNGYMPDGKFALSDDPIEVKKEQSEITIYPNPSSDVITISGLDNKEAEIKLFDVTGRQIAPSGLQKNNNSIEMDISNLPNATYLLLIESSNGTIYKKVIKN